MRDADRELLRPELVFLGMDAPDRASLFSQLGARFAPLGYVTPDWLERIEVRERAYPTGLATATVGIALPHADGCVARPYIAIVRPLAPVAFEPMAGVGDTVEAELVLNLGVTREGGQVEVLQGLMNLFMQEDPVRRLMAQTTGEGMVSTLLEFLG